MTFTKFLAIPVLYIFGLISTLFTAMVTFWFGIFFGVILEDLSQSILGIKFNYLYEIIGVTVGGFFLIFGVIFTTLILMGYTQSSYKRPIYGIFHYLSLVPIVFLISMIIDRPIIIVLFTVMCFITIILHIIYLDKQKVT